MDANETELSGILMYTFSMVLTTIMFLPVWLRHSKTYGRERLKVGCKYPWEVLELLSLPSGLGLSNMREEDVTQGCGRDYQMLKDTAEWQQHSLAQMSLHLSQVTGDLQTH